MIDLDELEYEFEHDIAVSKYYQNTGNQLMSDGKSKGKLEIWEVDLDGYDIQYREMKAISQNPTKFYTITREMEELYNRKNADYGDSFTKSLDEDGLLVAKIRMSDKLNRFSQLIKYDAQVKDESLRDTLIDLANYAAMTIIYIDEG